MWLVLRLIAVGIVSVARYCWQNRTVEGAKNWENQIVFRKGSAWGLALHSSWSFELLPERRSDRFLKRAGLVVEQQTGDAAFDARTYLRADSPALGTVLSESDRARTAVLWLWSRGCAAVRSDGEYIWMELPGQELPRDDQLRALLLLRDTFRATDSRDMLSREPVWRVAGAEALVWGIAAYAVVGLFELIGPGQAISELPRFFGLAALTAVILGVAIAFALRLVLQRSAWSSRVLVEGVVVLALVLPVAGAVAVLDVNRYLDRSLARCDYYQVIDRRVSYYQRAGGRGTVTVNNEYAVKLHHDDPGRPRLSRFIPVAREVYEAPASPVEVLWHPGALGIPWISEIQQGELYRPREMFAQTGRGRLIVSALIGLIVTAALVLSVIRRIAAR